MPSNATTVDKNRNKLVAGLTLVEQPAGQCPIATGEVGQWNDAGVPKWRNADGSDTIAATNAELTGALRCHAVVTVTLVSIGAGAFAYDNGTAGVGATLTCAANGAFPTVDGVAAALNNKYLVTAEVTGAYDGYYNLSTLGAGGAAAVLTRMEEFDESSEIKDGAAFLIRGGTLNADTLWRYTGADSPTVGSTSLVFARDPLVVTTNTAQSITAAKTFNAGTLKANNAGNTFPHTVASSATAARTFTLPDFDLTAAQGGVATASTTPAVTGTTAPTFTGTAPLGAFNTTAAFSGTGLSAVGQVLTSTDNQTMTLNQCAGMLLISATGNVVVIVSNTAVTGAPAVFTVLGKATTDAGVYSVLNGLAPVGSVATHTHTSAAHTHAQV